MHVIFWFGLIGFSLASSCRKTTSITLLHTNDVHAHMDQFNSGGTNCRPADITNNKCYGGVARIKTVVDAYRKNSSNVLLVDAGDQFQGTLFFNQYGGAPMAEFMNKLNYDLMTLGNHEFDNGLDHLANFIKNLTFPVVSSNIDLDEATPLIAAGVVPYAIIEKYKLGIIGYITNTTASISNIAKNITFYDPAPIVQKHVDELLAKGIKRIICVSHNGYQEDMDLARRTSGIQLIVGGHSHSLLLKNVSVPAVEGPYPTLVQNLNNATTYVVQAHRYGDYLGHVTLKYDRHDNLVSLNGDPILLDQTIPQDSGFQSRVNEYAAGFANLTNEVVAVSTDTYSNADCYKTDCAMGMLISDCLVQNQNTPNTFAFENSGGIRAAFSVGNVTYADVLTVLPFGNVVVTLNLTGTQVVELLEGVANGTYISRPQWSGIQWYYNSSLPIGERVLNITVGGQKFETMNYYTVITNDFVAGGGDKVMRPVSFIPGLVMADVMVKCLQNAKTITPASATVRRAIDVASPVLKVNHLYY